MRACVGDTDVVPELRSSHPSGRDTHMKTEWDVRRRRQGRLSGLQLECENRLQLTAGLSRYLVDLPYHYPWGDL